MKDLPIQGANMKTLKLRYDGKYEPKLGGERQWTLMSHFVDQNGQDRFRGSFMLGSLVQLGIVPPKVDSGCAVAQHCEHTPCCYCEEAKRVEAEITSFVKGA